MTSNADGALRWQVGAYYLNIERTVGVAQLEDDNRKSLPTSFVNELTDALVLDDFTTDVYAVFGSINYDITDRMELSVAVRYDREEREVENKVPSPADGSCRPISITVLTPHCFRMAVLSMVSSLTAHHGTRPLSIWTRVR